MRDYRFKPKRQSFLLGRLKLFIFLFLIVLVSLLSLYIIRINDFLKINSFEVRGGESLGSKTIIELLKPIIINNALAKFLGEDNILAWYNDSFLDIYKQYPRLESISISKDLFNRKVVIEVKEKEKLAAWCIVEAESCYWIDKTGEVFDTAPLVQGRIVRAVKDYSPNRSLNIGDKVLRQEETDNLIKIFDFLNSFNFTTKELKIEDIKYKEVNAFLEDGPEIRFGLNIDPKFGIPVIKSLRDSGEWSKFRYVDMRVEGRVYYSK